MIIDALTVLRKEIFEVWGNRAASRGPLVQSAMAVMVTGILIPSSGPEVWTDPRASALVYPLFASVLAASVAADAFAGERERRTLETLLATPLSDRAILFGKMGAAIVFSMSVIAIALLAGCGVVNLSRHATPFFFPPIEMIGALLAGAFGAALVMSSLATVVSMRVPVARSAQQISAVISMLLAAVVATITTRLGLRLDWALVLRIGLWLVVAGVVGVNVAGRVFSRQRFFETP